MSALKDFRDFILRGNVVDLAIGIVIGVAFGAVITALVTDLIMPLVAAIYGGKGAFETAYFTINGSKFLIGNFIDTVITFIIIAAVVFFFVVRPVNALIARTKKEPPADPDTRECPYCAATIPTKATKCMYCTSAVAVPAGVTSTTAQ